jgi:FMN phosphatase YigB (HAD superfamily)
MLDDVGAVTFDFYNTLAHHPAGDGGRGSKVMKYLERCGFASDPWEHQVLYDIFEPHGREYSPALSAAEKEYYLIRLTGRLFARLNVSCGTAAAAEHAAAIWQLIGPCSLVVFDDVPVTLQRIRDAGYRLAVLSNWQCGLGHFCEELGLARFFDHVIASAEARCEKPRPEIFAETCRRLGMAPDRVLHVGDTPTDDIEGATQAGIRAVLVCRDTVPPGFTGERISSLVEIPRLLGIAA